MRPTGSQEAAQFLIKVCYGSPYWQDLNPTQKPSFNGEREMSFPSSQLCTVGRERYLTKPPEPPCMYTQRPKTSLRTTF